MVVYQANGKALFGIDVGLPIPAIPSPPAIPTPPQIPNIPSIPGYG